VAKLPVRIGSSYELTPEEKQWFDDEVRRIDGVEQFFGFLDAQELEILRKGLGASIGYSHLEEVRRFVDKIFPADDWNGQEMRWYLSNAAAGFKLAMTVAESALEERQKVLLSALTLSQKAANARWDNDPAGRAMREVRKEWESWQSTASRFASDAAFARAMTVKYPAITSEGTVKNACSRWRKQLKSS